MRVELSIWEKLTRIVYILLIVSGVLAISVWYLPLIKKNERMRKEVLLLDTQIAKQEAMGRELRNSIEALKDPKAIERLARASLNYAKAGETVVRFEPPPGAPQK